MIFYYLDGSEVKTTEDVTEWGRFHSGTNRILSHTYIRRRPFTKGNKRMLRKINRNRFDVWVSTVFLGLDHSFNFYTTGPVRPVLWETMVFPKDSYSELDMVRYISMDQAEQGHLDLVEKYARTGIITGGFLNHTMLGS